MIVVGGEGLSDLADLWAFDLEQELWRMPEINFQDHFTPKRFHTLSSISDSEVVTFGGCYSEYVHLNEMHIFNLASFFEDPLNAEVRVQCRAVKPLIGKAPSTRWGHAAATHQNKLYVIGGRNDRDVSDIHEFDFELK